MRKWISFILAMCMIFTLAACNNEAPPSGSEPEQTERSSNTDAHSEPTRTPDVQTPPPSGGLGNASGSKILIAYFTWADNTVVSNPGSAQVDAVTSASVLPPGNTTKLAGWIQKETGGDLFQIITTEPYSSHYDECLDRAADEKAAGARPALTVHLDNMNDYDVIFLGYPNWWYTCPMAIFTFLEEYDFSGKTVIPFCAHGTGGLASSVKDITAALPDSTILEAFGSYRPDVYSAGGDVVAWVQGLGIEYAKAAGDIAGETRVKLAFDGNEVIVTMYDNPASKDFLSMLPLTLTFEDYNNKEKISSLPRNLTTEGAPPAIDPVAGDFTYYAPWGNLAIFYKDHMSSNNSLKSLGHIDSGAPLLAGISGEFEVIIEKVD